MHGQRSCSKQSPLPPSGIPIRIQPERTCGGWPEIVKGEPIWLAIGPWDEPTPLIGRSDEVTSSSVMDQIIDSSKPPSLPLTVERYLRHGQIGRNFLTHRTPSTLHSQQLHRLSALFSLYSNGVLHRQLQLLLFILLSRGARLESVPATTGVGHGRRDIQWSSTCLRRWLDHG